jgi:hypothetical protein
VRSTREQLLPSHLPTASSSLLRSLVYWTRTAGIDLAIEIVGQITVGVSITFQTPRARDAWATIQGYVYQVELTIARWIDIQLGEQLELERGEDLDLVSAAVTAFGEELERILEQVKHLEPVAVTLHSAQALANFHAHRIADPSICSSLSEASVN